MNKIQLSIKSIYLGLIAFLLMSSTTVFSQSDWKVDDAKAKIKNPVAADEASIKEGKTLFNLNCKSCHGDPGKNNGLPLVPKPTDMSNQVFLSSNSDGALFTKITEGKVTMPSFKAVLTETQRWQIVNYIRSLDPNKKIATVVETKGTGLSVGAPYSIKLDYQAENNKLVAFVEGTAADGSLAPAADVEVGFFVKRYFGNLPIGERGGVSDENGLISADIPVDLPGGEEGKAFAFAQFTDMDTFGDAKGEAEVNVKSVHHENLLDSRSLWTVRVMAPWWLIITYFSILIGVYATLGYVVLQLFQIKKEGA